MKANSPLERLYNGIIKENPTFVLMLGMCPTLAVTTSAKNGFGMGMTTMVILALSNLMISMLRKMIPDSVRSFRYRYCLSGSPVFPCSGCFRKESTEPESGRRDVYLQSRILYTQESI